MDIYLIHNYYNLKDNGFGLGFHNTPAKRFFIEPSEDINNLVIQPTVNTAAFFGMRILILEVMDSNDNRGYYGRDYMLEERGPFPWFVQNEVMLFAGKKYFIEVSSVGWTEGQEETVSIYIGDGPPLETPGPTTAPIPGSISYGRYNQLPIKREQKTNSLNVKQEKHQVVLRGEVRPIVTIDTNGNLLIDNKTSFSMETQIMYVFNISNSSLKNKNLFFVTDLNNPYQSMLSNPDVMPTATVTQVGVPGDPGATITVLIGSSVNTDRYDTVFLTDPDLYGVSIGAVDVTINYQEVDPRQVTNIRVTIANGKILFNEPRARRR